MCYRTGGCPDWSFLCGESGGEEQTGAMEERREFTIYMYVDGKQNSYVNTHREILFTAAPLCESYLLQVISPPCKSLAVHHIISGTLLTLLWWRIVDLDWVRGRAWKIHKHHHHSFFLFVAVIITSVWHLSSPFMSQIGVEWLNVMKCLDATVDASLKSPTRLRWKLLFEKHDRLRCWNIGYLPHTPFCVALVRQPLSGSS